MSSEHRAVVTVDATGAIIGWSDPTGLLGHRAGDVLGRDVADALVPDEFRDAHRHGFAAAMATGWTRIAGVGAHLPVRGADGTVRVLGGRLDVLRGPDGAPVGAVAAYAPAPEGAAPFTPVGPRWPAIRRVVANLPVADPRLDAPFWRDLLGMDTPMDQGWVVLHRQGDDERSPQVQLISRDATAPEDSALSVELRGTGELAAAHEAVIAAGYEIVHPLTDEPWGVRRFFVRTPGGVVVNVLTHP